MPLVNMKFKAMQNGMIGNPSMGATSISTPMGNTQMNMNIKSGSSNQTYGGLPPSNLDPQEQKVLRAVRTYMKKSGK